MIRSAWLLVNLTYSLYRRGQRADKKPPRGSGGLEQKESYS